MYNDVYSNETYDFNELAAKYNHFRQPVYKIKIEGKDINSDLGFYTDSVEITLTVKDSSGMCKFSICNAYDIKARKFKDSLKNNFPLGAKVDAYLGYGKPKLLFKGFVSEVSFSFDKGDAPKATVACVDIRALMKQGKLNASPPIASFPIIMLDILRRYASLNDMKIVYFDIWNILEEFRQNINDFNYIYDYGKKRGYVFFVLGESIYFLKKWMNLKPITTLKWGEGLLSFKRDYSYNASNIGGALFGLLSILPFSSSLPIHSPYPSNNTTPKIKTQLDTSDAKNTIDLVDIIANYAVDTIVGNAGGKVTSIGLPEIVPARFIALKDLDSNFLDRSYYIEEATHNFSGSGYTTSFSITSEL